MAIGSVLNQAEAETLLCAQCQDFDIQSFAHGVGRRKGYLLKDVEAAAHQGCQFCGLLLDALKDVEEPEYFYGNVFGGRTKLNLDLYVHMTISESHKDETLVTISSQGLRANRLLVELGDCYSGMRNPSQHEICVAADPRRYLLMNR
ncbi:hypothetical protein F5Y19DRAFT_463935 [Xylariaceae sp. FL1651]|nr:hypothetical protein F5Y19DRAFT_463935 [Xylariaceae sp. FL1651]